MSLFDAFQSNKKPSQNGAGGQKSHFLHLLSYYWGTAYIRQQVFGELVVRDRSWTVDLQKAVILFGEDRYPIQLLGTESLISGSWLWSFANPAGYPEHLTKDAESFYYFCKLEKCHELAGMELPLGEFISGHNIASMAAASRQGCCYYRCPYDSDVSFFVLVTGLPQEVFAPASPGRIIRVAADAIGRLPLDHRQLMTGMLRANCVEVTESESALIGLWSDGREMRVSFDPLGRIASMEETRTHKADS